MTWQESHICIELFLNITNGYYIIHFTKNKNVKEMFLFNTCQNGLQPSSSLATSRYLVDSQLKKYVTNFCLPFHLRPSSLRPRVAQCPFYAEILSRTLPQKPQMNKFFLIFYCLFFFLFNPNNFSEFIYSTALLTIMSMQLRQQQTGMFNWK